MSRHKNINNHLLKFFNKKCKEPRIQTSNTNSCALHRSLKFSSPLSGAKVSSVEQDTIEFVYLAYLNFIFMFKNEHLWFFHLLVMQHFSTDAPLLKKKKKKKKNCPRKNEKKWLAKVAYFTVKSEIFSNANGLKTSPNIIFCFIKM